MTKYLSHFVVALLLASASLNAIGAGTNVALQANGGVATASSIWASGYEPGSANNGERRGAVWGTGGGWHDNTVGVFPDWLQINFNASKTIDEIDVYSIQDNYANPAEPTATSTFTLYGLIAFDVQYWNGTTWVTVSGGSISNNNLVWRKINFPAVTTDRIRVMVNSGLNSYSRIAEVEAYTVSGGNVAPVITSVTAMPQTLLDSATSQLQVVANDPDGGPAPLSYTWSIQSGGGGLSSTTIANPIYTPANVASPTSVTINVAVTDGAATTNQSITLTLNDAGLPLATNTSTLPNGTVGTNYNQTLAASGGTPPYTWSVVTGALPAGLTLTPASGIISGTPTVAGSNNFTVRVTDANNATANQALSLTVASAPPASLSLTISADNAHEVYLNGVLLGTGNNWQQSSSYSAALLSGTNVLAVKGIDAGGVAAMIAELSWPGASAVSDATWKVSTLAPAGWETVGFNDSAWVNATSYGQYGVAPWYQNVVGFPTNSSANWIWSADSNNDDTVNFRYTFTVGSAPLAISITTLPNGTVGTNYNQTLAASGGTPPYTWSVVTGALPAGLTLTPATGIISGTPTVAGSNNFTVRVTDANNATANQALSLTVASAPPASLSLTISADNAHEVYLNGVLLGTGNNWQQSSSYSAALLSGTNVLAVKGIDAGGVAAMIAELSWPGASAVSGATWKVSTSAPAGWEAVGFNDSAWVNATSYGQYGVAPWYQNVVGFPTNSSANWIWSADSSNDDTVYFRYTFTVGSAPLAISITTLPNGTVGTNYNQTLAASGGTPPYTWSVVTGALPPGLTLTPATGSISGTPTLSGTSNFTVRVTDTNSSTANQPLTLTIASAAPLTGVYFIYTDHLNTPRVITDQTNKTVWRWDSDPFGTSAPFEDPDGDGVKFTYNNRFPGQYWDKETSTHYNWHRDYDPATGRYVQSDSLGLFGGSLSTYSYAKQNPLSFTDPTGKIALPLPPPPPPPSTGGSSKPTQPWPWGATNPIVSTPSDFPTIDPVDCDKQYHKDYEQCRNTCESVASGALCRLKAEIKYFFCKKRQVGNGLSGMDDGL